MQTYTGQVFYPTDPRAEEVDPVDIAHALGMICRYGGHAHRFYSVAEHCVLMSHAVPAEHALWALLHDAAEAYVGDMVSPLKQLMPAYRAVEIGVMRAIIERFDLPDAMPDRVAEADLRILLDERAAVLGPTPQPWAAHIEEMRPLGVDIRCWSPEVASDWYLLRLRDLTERDRSA
jgi:hypothetical protein